MASRRFSSNSGYSCVSGTSRRSCSARAIGWRNPRRAAAWRSRNMRRTWRSSTAGFSFPVVAAVEQFVVRNAAPQKERQLRRSSVELAAEGASTGKGSSARPARARGLAGCRRRSAVVSCGQWRREVEQQLARRCSPVIRTRDRRGHARHFTGSSSATCVSAAASAPAGG